MSRQFLSSEQWKQSLGWGETACWLNNVLCNYSLHLIAQCRAACWDVNSGAGPGSQGGEVRWWCPCPSAPSSPPLSSYERQQNHTNMIQCSAWGGHTMYIIPSVWCTVYIVANNMISCYWIGKQINMHHWVLSPHCSGHSPTLGQWQCWSGGGGGGQIVITWTYIVISAWGHNPPSPHPHIE